MKVHKLRETLLKIAEMQHHQGDTVAAKALEKLAEMLQKRDKDDVSKLVNTIQQRRGDRQTVK